ncbi:MAG TPA: Omp28-related outer membrane protein [Crocinitomicaceae bacterium]|nr:Omp28-related outer membrane protein [Crocinitomicaceae bacterium]
MKYIIGILAISLGLLFSCDKVNNAYPVGLPSTGLNWNLYPSGDSTDYVNNGNWLPFTTNTNTNRNIVVEDFTGHTCTYCPFAAVIAEDIKAANPGRAFIATIHTSELGLGSFQEAAATGWFTTDFTCEVGLSIGKHFGMEWPGSSFSGNPRGTVSRSLNGGTQPTAHHSQWTAIADNLIATNDLKVNIQANSNYFPSTRGYFLHVELDQLDAALTNEMTIVVQLIEDTIVKPQKFQGGTFPVPSPFDAIDTAYVHRDILRGCVDGRAFGQTLDVEHKDANGKYYFNYSYELPMELESTNTHVLIYVRDVVTEEIYHAIEQHIE